MICSLKSGFDCEATERLADESRCNCPHLVKVDMRAELEAIREKEGVA